MTMTPEPPPPTIAVVSAGVMGAAIAGQLKGAGCRVLTILDGRSEASRRRAQDVGMEDASFSEIAHEADWVLSIMPPGEAADFSRKFLLAYRTARMDDSTADHTSGISRKVPVFVDCNAKNPTTARQLASQFSSSPVIFIDASIIGLPPRDGHDPTFYASAEPGDAVYLDEFASLSNYGLRIKLLNGEGTGVGDASALKMAFSGIMKGMVGLYTTTILSASAHSPAIVPALLNELHTSRPADLKNISFYVPNGLSKAYRFVKEMEEVAGFVADGLDSGLTETEDGERLTPSGVSQVYDGLAKLFQGVADSVDGHGNKWNLDALRAFSEEAGRLLDADT